jgi:hypothetical protein
MQTIKRFMGLIAVAVLLASAAVGVAQIIFGSIIGTVTDSTGAVIPGATITVTDVSKGTSVTATTNGSGEFTVDHLIPDSYTVKITMAGFKTYQATSLPVSADDSRKIEAVLQTGGAGETITVSADSIPLLKTDRADVAVNFSAQEVEELPIPDHNFTNLQLLLPGAVQLGWAHAASENPQGSKQIQVDGQAFGGVNYTLDGTDNEDAILGIIVVNPNSESMSEVKIATQNFDAEFGKAVASVQSVQTKSGTNQFHGTVFDNRESNANLARDPFNVTKAAGYPGGLKNQFGGSVGGPVLKDKVFFFGDYQGVRQRVGGSGNGSVPSLLALQSCTGASLASNGTAGCDFSQYLNVATSSGTDHFPIYDNSSGTPTAYPGNIIPLSAVSPQAQNLFKLLLAGGKTPNVTPGLSNGGGLFNNYSGTGSGIFNSNQWDVRGDANLNERMHVFGRFSRFTDTLSGASLFGAAGGPGLGIAGFGGTSLGANDSLALGTDIQINPKLITDVRLGYFRYNITTTKNDTGNSNIHFLGENDIASLGVPDINIADLNVQNASGPSNAQNGGAQFGTGLNMNHCNCPLKEKEDQFQVVNNWTKTIGNHAVKFGVDLRYARNLRVPSDNDRAGVNNFGEGPTSDGSVGGLGWATFILGDVSSFNRYTSSFAGETNAKEFQKRDYFYAQDTWRATSKLTINAGLRYEFYGPERVNGKDNGALLNLETGYINVAGEGPIPLNMGVAAAKNTYNPRIGVAYQYNEKTVIRAGYGRSFDLGVFGSEFGHVVTQNLPVLANQSLTGTGNATTYAFNLSNPTAAPGVQNTSPLAAFGVPAISSAGQISIQENVPGTTSSIGSQVNVKARPFTVRLPTLDAFNVALQRSITSTLSAEIAYVGNKGSHTLSDGDGNNTNPNEPAIFLPASFTQNGLALHYDNEPADVAAITALCTATAGLCVNGIPQSGTYAGATSQSTQLRRYTNGNLPACVGACGWTQDISYYGNNQDTHYNALQAKVTKNYTKGLSINLNYAYARATSNASGFATWNKAAVRINDSAVRRSAFTGYGLYKLPFGHGQMLLGHSNSIVNYAVEGWEISPVFQWQSGLPYTLSYDECSQDIPGDAPCRVNGSPGALKSGVSGVPGQGNLTFFKAPGLGSGFTRPALDTIGNVGGNSVFGPRFFNADMSISKNITFKERYTAQFRMDAYNAFNHINLANPGGSVESGGNIGGGPFPAGIGGTTNPRQLQFTLHFQF